MPHSRSKAALKKKREQQNSRSRSPRPVNYEVLSDQAAHNIISWDPNHVRMSDVQYRLPSEPYGYGRARDTNLVHHGLLSDRHSRGHLLPGSAPMSRGHSPGLSAHLSASISAPMSRQGSESYGRHPRPFDAAGTKEWHSGEVFEPQNPHYHQQQTGYHSPGNQSQHAYNRRGRQLESVREFSDGEPGWTDDEEYLSDETRVRMAWRYEEAKKAKARAGKR